MDLVSGCRKLTSESRTSAAYWYLAPISPSPALVPVIAFLTYITSICASDNITCPYPVSLSSYRFSSAIALEILPFFSVKRRASAVRHASPASKRYNLYNKWNWLVLVDKPDPLDIYMLIRIIPKDHTSAARGHHLLLSTLGLTSLPLIMLFMCPSMPTIPLQFQAPLSWNYCTFFTS